MSTAREEIFAALEAARPPAAGEASRVAPPAMPSDPLAILGERLAEAGGRLQTLQRSARLAGLEWPLELAAAEHVYSAHPALESRGLGVTGRTAHELAELELCVLVAELAVVENGAAWHVPASPRERSAALLAEHLVVSVAASALVPSLHDAYARIDLSAERFGWLLCGPSKTADIEQSLVLGAHGPRTMTLLLERDRPLDP